MPDDTNSSRPETINAHAYASAKQVEDFHRNSDKDKRPESQHHTIGRSRLQASPGDHSHDGGTSLGLWNEVLSGNIGDDAGQIALLQQIVALLVEKGAQSTVTATGVRFEIETGAVNVTWATTGTSSGNTAVSFTAGRFSAAPRIWLQRSTPSVTALLESRVSGGTTAGFNAWAVSAVSQTSGFAAAFHWLAINSVTF